jgi:murein DD-endopeptidase MepM/ murein hydrolase activator NlpD
MVVRDLVPRAATLDALLRNHGVDGAAARGVIEAVAGVFDPRQLRSLQPFVIERTVEGALRLFEYEIDGDRFLRVTPKFADTSEPEPIEAVDLHAEVLPIPKTREEASAAITIGGTANSLFAAIQAAGEGAQLAYALAQIFSGEIDFNSEIQLGDRFVAVFERFRRADGTVSYGDILGAEVHADGRVLRAIQFAPGGGPLAYYDAEGRSTKRFFLKSPLEFEPRITSGFNLRRRHPVLHTTRAHRGVDYGAPRGAPVVAVAAGTVVGATYDRANGNMVRIRHAGGFETYYLHLSRFAPGIRGGVRVSQGQRVGFVGSTGLSTGPHLHYGLKKNGSFVNPVVEHRNMPPGEPISKEAMTDFLATRDRVLAALAAAQRSSSPATTLARAGSPERDKSEP